MVGVKPLLNCFNSQPLEGGCHAAVFHLAVVNSFNSQPLEGGCAGITQGVFQRLVSTHSRSKAAARWWWQPRRQGQVSTHSRSKAAATQRRPMWRVPQFQLTAARRRLRREGMDILTTTGVSTHSRSKAAAATGLPGGDGDIVSTHSRSKAAATAYQPRIAAMPVSTHSRSKAAA